MEQVVLDSFYVELEKISANIPRWARDLIDKSLLGVTEEKRLTNDLIRRMREAAERQGNAPKTVIEARPARIVERGGVRYHVGYQPRTESTLLSTKDPETLITRDAKGRIVGRQTGPNSALTGRPDPQPPQMEPIHKKIDDTIANVQAGVEKAKEDAAATAQTAAKAVRQLLGFGKKK